MKGRHNMSEEQAFDDDFTLEKAPKRNNYRRISAKTKKDVYNLYCQENLRISELCKRFHLSYATVAHIVKFYKEPTPASEQKIINIEERAIKKQELFQQKNIKFSSQESFPSPQFSQIISWPQYNYYMIPFCSYY